MHISIELHSSKQLFVLFRQPCYCFGESKHLQVWLLFLIVAFLFLENHDTFYRCFQPFLLREKNAEHVARSQIRQVLGNALKSKGVIFRTLAKSLKPFELKQ